MNVDIIIEKNIVHILLKSKSKILNKIAFPEARDLSRKLLPNIDKLLKKNKIEPEEIERMELKSDTSETYTTYRIAKAVTAAFNWSAEKRKDTRFK